MLASNPLIERYRFSQMRPQTVAVYLIIYSATVALLALWAYAIRPQQLSVAQQVESIASFLFLALTVTQVVLICIWSAVNTSQTLTSEIERKSYDFFRLLPLTSAQKAQGIMIGRNLSVIMLGGINLILLTLLAYWSRYGLIYHGQVQVVIASLGLCFNGLGLLNSCSSLRRKKVRRNSPLSIVILAFIGAQMVVPLIFMGHHAMGDSADIPVIQRFIPFYLVEIQVVWVVAALAICGFAWAYAGTLRALTSENQPLFSPLGAIGFMVTVGFITLGFVLTPRVTPDIAWACFGGVVVILLVVSILIQLGVRLSHDQYLEACRRYDGSAANGLRRLSNLRIAVWLLGTIMVAWWIASRELDITGSRPLALTTSALFVFLTAVLLGELFTLLKPRVKQAGMIVGFITILYAVLPLILHSSGQAEWLTVSSVTYFFNVLVDEELISSHPTMVVLSLAWCLLLASPVVTGYRRLIRLAATIK